MPAMEQNQATQSLINRTGFILGVIMLLAIINMLVSFLTAENAENDAVRINLAGSLRMQSYRIAEALFIQDKPQYNPENTDLVAVRIKEFEDKLYRAVLSGHIKYSKDTELVLALDKVNVSWLLLKSELISTNQVNPGLLQKISHLVDLIDELVKALEVQTENKFRFLRIIQGISLLVTLVVVALGFVDINNNIIVPLRKLLQMANRLQHGDFTQRLKVEGDDELAMLSKTFNDMSENLNLIYSDLEQKISDKTKHLNQAKDSLSLLYETSQLLSAEGTVIERIERSLININQYFSEANILVDLSQDGKEAFRISVIGQNDNTKHIICKRFNIGRGTHIYGNLLSYSKSSLEEEKLILLQSIADNMATALNTNWQQDQQHRLVLMEERAVIARELHDSLAQSLSYLKIQISRLQILRSKVDNPEEIENTIQHIKIGINAAYGELRELLATFRLQLSNDGLQGALEKTTAEFSEKSDIEIKLEYGLLNFPLTPNEEIHLLQITREAISNVARHSGANYATISIQADNNKDIELHITDNGCGFKNQEKKTNHYGMVIMQERANSLDGKVKFTDNEKGGASVQLFFTPDVAKNNNEKTG